MMREIFENFADQEWKTKAEIINHASELGIKLSERQLRQEISLFNKHYLESELYIAHGPKGYKLTTNSDEIKASILDLKKRSLNMLKNYHQTLKELGNKTNLTLFDINDEQDVYELIKKMEEN